MEKEELGNQKNYIGAFLDNVCKFFDNTNHITTRLIGENMKVDAGIYKFKTNITKVVNDSVPKSKTIKPKKGTNVLNKLNEKELRNYVKVTRCIPSIMILCKYDNIEEFCNSRDWSDCLSISNTLFLDNYHSSDEFKGIVDALVRQYTEKTKDERKSKLYEYLQMVS
jgi:hypothetical protein